MKSLKLDAHISHRSLSMRNAADIGNFLHARATTTYVQEQGCTFFANFIVWERVHCDGITCADVA
jgi:hypothetical protein